jgi:hypothetical protein
MAVMALIKCIECGAEVSDKAAACPKCGHPVGPRTPFQAAYVPPPREEKKGGWLKWVAIVPAALFGLVMCIGSVSDPNGKHAAERDAAHRQECAEAMTSSIGHSTVGYADKAAYDAKVRDKCDGLTFDGKPIGQ